MIRFRYRAVGLDGREITGEADARDVASLSNDLGPRGLILVEASPDSVGGSAWDPFTPSVDPRQVTTFLSELALMLRSGQSIDEALNLLGDGMPGAFGRVVRAVRVDILGGTSFVDALSKHGDAFPPEVLALARVSDATGRLDKALDAVAQQRNRTHVLTEKVASALRYPAFLLVAAAGVLVFFLIYVIPQFSAVIKDAGGNNGAGITGIIYVSDLLNDNLELFGAGAIALLVLGLLAYRSKAVYRGGTHVLSRLPIISGIAEMRRTALFCLNLGTLLGQGVPIPDALKVLEKILGGESGELLASLGDSVRRGGRLTDALNENRFLPRIAQRMLRIGEDTGELASVAAEAGALYERKLEQRLDRVVALVGPIAVMTIASLIGGLMVTIMSALMSINQMAL